MRRSQFVQYFIAGLALPLSGLVFGVEFLVTDESGAPLENAVVELVAAPRSQPDTTPAVMDQVNRQFVPHVLAIQQGRQVEFPNSDNVRHHVYSFSPAKTFEIKMYKGIPGAPTSFDVPGVVALGCNIHDRMIGYIYVAESAQFALSGSDGRVSLPAGNHEVRVWHPAQQSPQRAQTVSFSGEQSAAPIAITVNIRPQP